MSGTIKLRSSSVKRIMSELRELQSDDTLDFIVNPIEDNLFEWHFTMRGPQDTVFEKGLYHGKIILPTEYPFKAPHVIFLTPNGRWSVDTKVCVTFTGFHEESWQPAWGIRTAMLGVQALMSSKEDEAGYGAASMNDEGRKMLAEQSTSWTCPQCQVPNAEILSGKHRSQGNVTEPLPGVPQTKNAAKTEGSGAPEQQSHDTGNALAKAPSAKAAYAEARTQSPEHEQETKLASLPPPNSHAHGSTSLAGKLQERMKLYERIVSMVESLMTLICLVLILLVLKNL